MAEKIKIADLCAFATAPSGCSLPLTRPCRLRGVIIPLVASPWWPHCGAFEPRLASVSPVVTVCLLC